MKIATTIAEVRAQVREWKQQGLTVGLVPTMGFLHRGHATLVDRAREGNDVVVVSVFVNPLQFGPNEDYARYPRDLDADRKLLAEHGAEEGAEDDADGRKEEESCVS